MVGSWLPERHQQVFVTVWDIATNKTGGYVLSRVVLAAVSCAAHALVFWILGVPYWLAMGLFAGVIGQLVPTVGTYLGVAIPALLASFVDPIDVVWIIAFATVYQQIENYVLTPRISRATMDVHPAVALAAVIGGVALLGPIGAVVGIPLAAAGVAVMETYRRQHALTPELAARTKGERPPQDEGDVLAGDPTTEVPAGLPLSELPEILARDLNSAVADLDAASEDLHSATRTLRAPASEAVAGGNPSDHSNDPPARIVVASSSESRE
jgi:hypothetical protein